MFFILAFSQEEPVYTDMNGGYVPTDMTGYFPTFYPCFWSGYTMSDLALKDSLKKQM